MSPQRKTETIAKHIKALSVDLPSERRESVDALIVDFGIGRCEDGGRRGQVRNMTEGRSVPSSCIRLALYPQS